MSDESIDQPAPEALAPEEPAKPAKPAKKPRKPRAPRKKKGADADPSPVEAAPAEPPSQEPPSQPIEVQPEPDDLAERAAIEAEQPADQVVPAHVNGNGYTVERELQGAKPRRSGDRPWRVELGEGEHVWERLETPGPDSRIAFRFKDHPTEEQAALIEKYGFVYDPEEKRAYRANDIAGRTYADKLGFFLEDLSRGRGQAVAI
jgi:hypothetical protein